MRAREFIREDIDGRTGSITTDVGRALPGAWKIPELQNQDPYLQYRFGVALAATKGKVHGDEQPGEDVRHHMDPRSAWGENMVIVSYDPKIGDWIDAALHEVGLSSSDKKLISTPNSEEPKTIGTTSPIKGFKGFK